MQTLYTQEKGFTHIIMLASIILLLGIGGTGYYVYQKHNSQQSIPITSEKKTPSQISKFSVSTDVYDFIASSIENSGLGVTLLSQAKATGNPASFTLYPSSNKEEVKYISGYRYFLSKACTQACDTIRDEQGNLAGGLRLDGSQLEDVLTKIKDSLSTKPGIKIVTSGSEPGTYVMHYYINVRITLTDGSDIKLQVSTEGGDVGEYINAFMY